MRPTPAAAVRRLREWRTAARLLRSGLFDTDHYVGRYADVVPKSTAAALHYVRHGAEEGRDPNAYFHTRWYVDRYPDVAASDVNPLEHYLLAGAAEGRDPGPDFVTSWYLGQYEDVRASGCNPLAHFLRVGLPKGRLAQRPGTTRRAAAPSAVAPAPQEWEAASARRSPDADVVVVVPVYGGAAETLRCLHSVLTARPATDHRLLVIDDASPEPELSTALRELSAQGLFDLLVNERNLGFVKTANRGMRAAGTADVVLLNSDTEVYGDWLDRLRAAAYAAPDVGTVTPLTGNGQLASYPQPLVDNDAPLEVPFDVLDGLAGSTGAGHVVDVPTCVGFCTYVRRACLDTTGLLDEEAFGLGYGEENDFSLRAAGRGWRHVLAVDVFVRHRGGASFGASAGARQRAGLAVLQQRYPGYSQLIAEHVRRDPAFDSRRRLDAARLQHVGAGRPAVLLVTHALGGGTARHVDDLAERLFAAGALPLVLRPGAAGREVWLSSPLAAATPNLRYAAEGNLDPRLVEDLRALDVRLVHLHHLQGLAEHGPALVRSLVAALGVPLDVTVHDWMWLCPRVDMVDGSERYCGGPGPEKCRTCLARNGSPFGQPDPVDWRRVHGELLETARRVVVPTPDAAARLAQVWPELRLQVLPHPEVGPPPDDEDRSAAAAADGRVHVALLGAMGLNKGSRVLAELARDAARRRLPLVFHVFGYSDIDAELRRAGPVEISGRYAPQDLPEMVRGAGCRLALFPAVTPETWSYTLSEAWDLGLWPVALDLGALAVRIRSEGHGEVLPWEALDDLPAVNDRLLALAPHGAHRRPRADYGDVLRDYYGLDLRATRSS